MKNFIFVSPVTFEKWDYKNPLEKGIGGSETAVVELSTRLAKRGHNVKVYAPTGKKPENFKDVKWLDNSKINISEEGIWILCRIPELAGEFPNPHPKQTLYLQMQDVDYSYQLSRRGIDLKVFDNIDYLLPLCKEHMLYTKDHYPKAKLMKSANGVRSDLINSLKREERDPFRMMYASSPDRGLVHLLQMFPRIRELEPKANLHIFYGFNNIEKMIDQKTPIDSLGTTINYLMELMKYPGITWHGRIGQLDLYKEWLKSGIWAYPTRFSETSCIVSMEAQALGAIPVTNPWWALKDNIMYGSRISGDVNYNAMVRERYIEEVVYWMHNGDSIRKEMMTKARSRFDWEKVVDQYEGF